MEDPKIYCLMVSGGSINDQMRNLLFDNAQRMIKKSKNKVTLKSKTFEGEIRTKGKTGTIGSICGQLFHATLETDKGKYKINYLVRPGDVHSSQGSWHAVNDEDPDDE